MLGIIRTKKCRRCGGDLALERDKYGGYISCIQCGGVDRELPEPVPTSPGPRLMEQVRIRSTKVGAGFRYFDG